MNCKCGKECITFTYTTLETPAVPDICMQGQYDTDVSRCESRYVDHAGFFCPYCEEKYDQNECSISIPDSSYSLSYAVPFSFAHSPVSSDRPPLINYDIPLFQAEVDSRKDQINGDLIFFIMGCGLFLAVFEGLVYLISKALTLSLPFQVAGYAFWAIFFFVFTVPQFMEARKDKKALDARLRPPLNFSIPPEEIKTPVAGVRPEYYPSTQHNAVPRQVEEKSRGGTYEEF